MANSPPNNNSSSNQKNGEDNLTAEFLIEEYGWMADPDEDEKQMLEEIKAEDEFMRMVEQDLINDCKVKMNNNNQQRFNSNQNNTNCPPYSQFCGNNRNNYTANYKAQSQFSSNNDNSRENCTMASLNRGINKLSFESPSHAQPGASNGQPSAIQMQGVSGSLNINAKEFVPKWKLDK